MGPNTADRVCTESSCTLWQILVKQLAPLTKKNVAGRVLCLRWSLNRCSDPNRTSEVSPASLKILRKPNYYLGFNWDEAYQPLQEIVGHSFGVRFTVTAQIKRLKHEGEPKWLWLKEKVLLAGFFCSVCCPKRADFSHLDLGNPLVTWASHSGS